MLASAFSAIGDMVKYDGVSGMPDGHAMNQQRKVKKFEEKEQVVLIRKISDIPSSIGPNDVAASIDNPFIDGENMLLARHCLPSHRRDFRSQDSF